MQPIIQLENVSFSYSQEASRALTDVSLCIEQGEFVGVIGPSGAGKSTLAAVLSGAIPHHYRGAFYGAARVEGRDTCEISLTDIARVVGAVAQDIDAQMVASVVEDEMLFGLENFGVPHDQIEGRIQRALATVGIEQLRDHEIATLSGGQKQKVAIAAILALEPRVLVLDEPTAALDPVSSRMAFETLREVNRVAGVTVVVIEQMVALLSEFCERVIVMNKGSVALDGTPREVFAHAEDLRAIGVDSPRVTRVYNSMRAQNLLAADQAPCLNVPEAADMIARALDGHAAPNQSRAGELQPSPHAPARPHARGAQPVLRIENASFSYPAGGAAVRDLAMEVYPGELVGVVNAKSSDSDAEGLGFAIPINDAMKVAQDLLENGYVTGRPYMGITYLAVTDAQTAQQLGVNAYGIYVADVVKGGPADKAGLKVGDRIVSIDGTEVAQKTDLGTIIQQHSAGDTLSITVARGGQMQTVSLTLGEKNNSTTAAAAQQQEQQNAESAQEQPQG